MDLGCLDSCSLSVCEKHIDESVDDSKKKDGDAEEPILATAKVGKNKSPKDAAQSALNAVNKSNLQIRKSHRRSSSPLNWFPRRKTDSYLKRKIRLLQEVGGMNATLDETLGDSNPHYSRVLREKIAARNAACKAMEARKAAMVEASWCRILRAARIQSKEAESLLLEAEKNVAEAFKAASSVGVVLHDRPDCPKKPCEVESSSINMGGSTTHTVTATFETAFEVDKEVAAAVKQAFIRLATCHSSSNKDEFRDFLWKISQNPDMIETNEELSECLSGCESDTGSEHESESQRDESSQSTNLVPRVERKQVPDINSTKLVDMMLERLKCLQEEELASLATIVATCGLSAALLEVANTKHHDSDSLASTRRCSLLGTETMRYPSMDYLKDGMVRRRQEPELPSLDKFLVKHMSKLEREVQEAKNKRKGEGEISDGTAPSVDNYIISETVPDLESILVKKNASKLEKEIEMAKKTSGKIFDRKCKASGNTLDSVPRVPSLDTVLVKHMSRLEREVQEAKSMRRNEVKEVQEENPKGSMKRMDNSFSDFPDLGSVLVKYSSSKLEKEMAEEKKKFGTAFVSTDDRVATRRTKGVPEVPGLDKVLVKHVSRLEKEVQEAKDRRKDDLLESSNLTSSDNTVLSSQDGSTQVGKENIDTNQPAAALDGTVTEKMEKPVVTNATSVPSDQTSVETPVRSLTMKTMSRIERAKLESMEAFSGQNLSSLDNMLVKPVHRLEREKMQALARKMEYETQHDQKKHEETPASEYVSLDKILVKHVSRLEKEKLAASKEDLQKVRRKISECDNSAGSLDQIFVKHQPRIEKEKFSLSRQPDDRVKHSESRRAARERELEEAWGGLSLGNAVRPHISRLEKDKAAWIKAEEEERRQTKREI